MNSESGLREEQDVVNVLYARLDDIRDDATARLADIRREGPSGSPQNRSERDAFATLYEDRVAQLDAVEDRLCFGRLDMTDGERHYVGRLGLSDADHAPLLTDWRAPAARAFYSATAANPGGVMNRRHLTLNVRDVVAVEDDVLDVEALRASGREGQLAGEGALLAALDARRTGRMGDIVATIQAEQDAVIRADMQGALVVQGGPGSGKTAVALHRAAYLLYTYRERLASSGVLLIGPSSGFLKYIDHVLPSLGETGVVSTTLAGLIPGVRPSLLEVDEVAELKGRSAMASVIKSAVRERQRLPRADQSFSIDGRIIVIRRHDIEEAQAKARRDGKPHNTARKTFAKEMLARLTAQLMEQLEQSLGDDDRRELRRDLADNREVRIALNLAWLPISPATLLDDLFSKRHLLDHAAGAWTAHERDLLSRPSGSPLTDADMPLYDEAAELLGELPGGGKKSSNKTSKEELDYAKSVLDNVGGGMVTAEMLAERMSVGSARQSVAERAANDRAWAYGHIVVDEAQELSPMAWRMLLRRCPTRSLTIVGDVAQTTAPAGTRWWPEMLDPLLGNSWTMRELTISYRIPSAVAEAAQAFARAANLPVSELTAARDVPDAVAYVATDSALVDAVALARKRLAALEESGGGVCALVVPDSLAAEVRQRVGAGTAVDVVTARESKGLEYDSVVVVEPHLIAARPGDLYVALTRATQHVDIVHSAPLPAGLG